MTELEQRLRDELHRISERADAGSIRPLRDPGARGRSRLVRWLAPVAAVAAVIGVIAGVSLAGRPAVPPETAAPGVMPPYYVVVQTVAHPMAMTATVRDSRTGAALTSVRLPYLPMPNLYPGLAISAAADDRTFLITDDNDLFLLRLAADGRLARLTRLAITLTSAIDGTPNVLDSQGAALSPDGRTVAIEGQSSCTGIRHFVRLSEAGCRDNVIRLVSLATGTARTWSTEASWQPVMWISWDGNDHLLFSWAGASKSGPQRSGYRLLNLAAPGSSLLAARTMPLPPLPVFAGPSVGQSAFVTPDGLAVIASTFKLVGGGGGGEYTVIMSLDEFSARTGRLVGVLREATLDEQSWANELPNDEGCSVLALGPEGVHALVWCVAAQTVFGRLDNGRFTPLPGMPDLDTAPNQGDAAW
jgi:hypothetical protein